MEPRDKLSALVMEEGADLADDTADVEASSDEFDSGSDVSDEGSSEPESEAETGQESAPDDAPEETGEGENRGPVDAASSSRDDPKERKSRAQDRIRQLHGEREEARRESRLHEMRASQAEARVVELQRRVAELEAAAKTQDDPFADLFSDESEPEQVPAWAQPIQQYVQQEQARRVQEETHRRNQETLRQIDSEFYEASEVYSNLSDPRVAEMGLDAQAAVKELYYQELSRAVQTNTIARSVAQVAADVDARLGRILGRIPRAEPAAAPKTSIAPPVPATAGSGGSAVTPKAPQKIGSSEDAQAALERLLGV